MYKFCRHSASAQFAGTGRGRCHLLDLQHFGTAELVKANHLAHTKTLLDRTKAARLKQPTKPI
jgi:hypothetical protein